MNPTPLTVTAPDLRAPFRYLVIEGPIGVCLLYTSDAADDYRLV